MKDSCILPLAERMELALAYKAQNPLTPISNVAYTFDVPRSTDLKDVMTPKHFTKVAKD